jgi:hypothetical protein
MKINEEILNIAFYPFLEIFCILISGFWAVMAGETK